MVQEHICKEHGVPFIKTDYGWAHRVVDKDGNQVMTERDKPKWCREPKKESTQTEKAELSPTEIRLRIAEIAASLCPGDIDKCLDYADALNRWISGESREKKPVKPPTENLFPPDKKETESIGATIYERLRAKVPWDRWTDREITLWLDSKFQVGTNGLYETLGKLAKAQLDILGEEVKKRSEKF